ncbi:protein of unknown function [Micropruina glycogenica]|uniref:DhaK domain-containing protein n=1 Tax=Micropruina glycogenica TaxID=75385 RepID=A0A2N9JL85_9ACTN|nr:protein of unknown function [Micropruina glycogenica]
MPLIEPRRNEESPPRFELGDNEMELGIGVHGEPGVKRVPMMKADDIVDTLLDKVLDDLKLESGENVLLSINGLGATRRASSTSCTTTLTTCSPRRASTSPAARSATSSPRWRCPAPR